MAKDGDDVVLQYRYVTYTTDFSSWWNPFASRVWETHYGEWQTLPTATSVTSE